MQRVLPFTHSLLENVLHNGDIAIDCTAGNGHDTKLLAELVGTEGKIFAFDIQKKAITNTKERLEAANLHENVELIHDSHSNMKIHIPDKYHGQVKAAVFNLGYLPGGDKNIVTNEKTTVKAIEHLLDIMSPNSLIAIVVYHGHPEGQTERDELLHYVRRLEQKAYGVLQYQFLNPKNNPPFLIAIQKK
ncbi:class I SAM-dependent methyltransferase [Bacillus solimangrovi]|uniref:16S rRNA (Cytosine(1402)-N(4))-methyltransferase n=1 Tax=Bacillus solimangrovi TaxID=1305675 RepID=A0A1E5LDE2_9BACI|nr:class I SAM-dependent methyltransferase [Bacillus solimangrovi]OEH92117.1 16S rRNA (cytosine(1402)-N(4))-methyltransferase [Bacillus solimangrovi]